MPAGLTDPDASNDSATDTDTLTAAAPAGVTVTPTAGLVTTERGGTAAFTVVLDRQPAAGVTIALASSDPHEGTVAPAALTFTAENWNVPQTATVTGAAAADDGDDEGDVPYTIVTGDAVSADPGYSGLAVADVAVTNRDDAGGRFHTLPPCRLLDTRRPQDGAAFVSGASQRLAVTGFCGIPAGARALALNVTVVAPSAPGNLVLHPGDAPPPLASTINFAFGANRANNAIVPLSADGTLAARPFVAGAGTVDVVLDVTGYFD